MIFKSSFKNSKGLDSRKYLLCFLSRKVPKDLSCDYLIKDILPPFELYRLKERREITEKEFRRRYIEFLKDSSREFSIMNIIELLEETSKILSKDIVLCGEDICNIVCEVIEETSGESIKEIIND